jgi:hypothetical protein
VKPRAKQLGLRQAGYLRFGGDERIPQRNLCDVATAEHAPAILEKLVAVGIQQLSQRAGRFRTQAGDDLIGRHAEKLEQTDALGQLFKITSD